MAKDVQMSIKMEPELRDRFMTVAAERHRPAAQIIRDLMRLYIAESELPNARTAQTLRKSREGGDVIEASSVADLLAQIGLCLARFFIGQSSAMSNSRRGKVGSGLVVGP